MARPKRFKVTPPDTEKSTANSHEVRQKRFKVTPSGAGSISLTRSGAHSVSPPRSGARSGPLSYGSGHVTMLPAHEPELTYSSEKSNGGCDYFRWFDGGPLPAAASSVIGNLVRKLKDTEDNCVLLRQLLCECEDQNNFLKIMLREGEMKLKEAERKRQEAEQKSHRLKMLIKSMVAGCVICSVFKWISY